MARINEHRDEYQRMMAEAMGREPPPPSALDEEIEIEGDRSELNAIFGVSFREDAIPARVRVGDITTAVLAAALERLKLLGLHGVQILSLERDSVSLRISGHSVFSVDEVARLLSQTGRLEFRLVRADNDELVAKSRRGPGGFQIPEGCEKCEMVAKRGEETVKEVLFVQARREDLSGQDVERAVVTRDEFGRSISLTFTRKGADVFRRITAENVGRRLAVVVDGEVRSAPVIQQAITGGKAQITGSFSLKEAKVMAAVLRSGQYPVPVQVEAVGDR